jgi:hypothetical protein
MVWLLEISGYTERTVRKESTDAKIETCSFTLFVKGIIRAPIIGNRIAKSMFI